MSVPDASTQTGHALQYTLQEQIVPGDVGIIEPGVNCTAQQPQLCSDALRFFNRGGVGFMRSYSDLSEGPSPDLADTGLPANLNPTAFAVEVGPEGANTFIF
jgi:hypothetical protein